MKDEGTKILEVAKELFDLVLSKENQRILEDTGKPLFNHSTEVVEIYRGKTLMIKINLLYNEKYFRKLYKKIMDNITLTFLVSKNGYVKIGLKFEFIHTKKVKIKVEEEVSLGKGELRDILINLYLFFNRVTLKTIIETIADVIRWKIKSVDLINIPTKYIVGKIFYEIFNNIYYTNMYNNISYSLASFALHQSYAPYLYSYLSAFLSNPRKIIKENYKNLGLKKLTDEEFFKELIKFEKIDYKVIRESSYIDTDFIKIKKRFINAYSKSPHCNYIYNSAFFSKKRLAKYNSVYELYKSVGNSTINKLKNKTIII